MVLNVFIESMDRKAKERNTRFKHRQIQKSYPTGGSWIAEMKNSRI